LVGPCLFCRTGGCGLTRNPEMDSQNVEKGNGLWERLPAAVAGDVLHRLQQADLVAVATACWQWRAAVQSSLTTLAPRSVLVRTACLAAGITCSVAAAAAAAALRCVAQLQQQQQQRRSTNVNGAALDLLKASVTRSGISMHGWQQHTAGSTSSKALRAVQLASCRNSY
jgi:hypothetical protein